MLFLHRGKHGDIIALGAWLKKVYDETGESSQIYVRQHKPYHKWDVDWIRPLLLTQPYYKKIDVCQKITDVYPGIPQVETCDLKFAREVAQKYNYYTGWWVDQQKWWDAVGAPHKLTDLRYRFTKAYKKQLPQTMQPWITLPQHQKHIKEPYIVVSVTPRYRCCVDFSALYLLKDKYRIVFIGHKHDYDYFGKSFAEFYQVNSSIEMAQLIHDAQLTVSTQSLVIWLAQAMGVDRILSISNLFIDTHLRVQQGFRGAFSKPSQLALQLYSWRYSKGIVPSIGYVISTYGSPAYIDLQLAYHKGKWNHDVIVADDGSKDEKLKQVCAKWGVSLLGVDQQRRGHQNGDLEAYRKGLNYFKDKDWVVKISRRCLWTQDLQQSIIKHSNPLWKPILSDWWVPDHTFETNRAITTCCFATHTKSIPLKLMQEFFNLTLAQTNAKGKLTGKQPFMQTGLYQTLQKFFGEIPLTQWREVYKQRGREQFVDSIIWKNAPIEKYKQQSDKLGLQWQLNDFKDIIKE